MKEQEYKVRPTLCLDFDGTIRRSKSGAKFIKNSNDIELIPGVEELILKYKNEGYLILGISNQAGVAHGFKSVEDVENEFKSTLGLFKTNPFYIIKKSHNDAAGRIFPYNHRSLSRKPGYGMLAVMESEAFNDKYIIDWDNSLFVGDRPEDEQCANSAGIKFKHIDDFLK